MKRLTHTALANPHLPVPAYLAVIGVVGIAAGRGIAPDELTHLLPGWLVASWTIAVTLGGIAATAGCLLDRTRVESAGLYFLLAGIGVYGLTVIPAMSGAGVAGVLALGSVCAIRAHVLGQAREAQKEAQRLLTGEEQP